MDFYGIFFIEIMYDFIWKGGGGVLIDFIVILLFFIEVFCF